MFYLLVNYPHCYCHYELMMVMTSFGFHNEPDVDDVEDRLPFLHWCFPSCEMTLKQLDMSEL